MLKCFKSFEYIKYCVIKPWATCEKFYKMSAISRIFEELLTSEAVSAAWRYL